MKHLTLLASASILAFAACEPAATDTPTEPAPIEAPADTTPETVAATPAAALNEVLKQQPKEVKARYNARHPGPTLKFFDIEPGMKVAEALPGGGWYSKILIPYLGSEGELVGAHYPDALWAQFGWDEERVQSRIESTNNWVASTDDWGVSGAAISDYKITEASADLDGTLDAVLFIRALHNLNRFDYTDAAIAESYRLLKPGGIVGVVQHRAPEDAPDESATGERGYLKQSTLIAKFEAAGFELDGTSEINANPKDTPGADQVVWRLAPSLGGTEEGTPEREAMAAIGESDRMTLKFKKPS